jgi:RNA polymerase sigma factor (sigma-70 family)
MLTIADEPFRSTASNHLTSNEHLPWIDQVDAWSQQWGGVLVLFARQWCRQPEDAVQDAFVDLICLKDCPLNPKAWLFRTVRCKAMNQLRSERRRSSREVARVQASWFTPNATCNLELEEVRQALESLEDEDREIVVSKIWGELTFEEIAQIVDRSPSSVYRCYQRAIQKLATRLHPIQISTVAPTTK